jgi:hypothetical protein
MFIPNPDFFSSRIPIPGARGQRSTGSRIWIGNSAYYAKRKGLREIKTKELCYVMTGKGAELVLISELAPWEKVFLFI